MNTEIKLSRSYETNDGSFDTIVLREPTYGHLFMAGYGRPFDFQISKHNVPVRMEYPDVVDQYAKLLIVSPAYEDIGQIAAIDAIKVKDAICSFFRERTEPRE